MNETKYRYPECEKLVAARHDSQVISEFLDWLNDEDIVLAEYSEDAPCVVGVDQLTRYRGSLEKLLARFFEIDLAKLEAEKREILNRLREKTEGG